MILGGLFDLEKREAKIAELEKQTMEESFWNDKRKSSAVIKEMNGEKEIVAEYKKLEAEVGEEEVLIDFIEMGEEDFQEELEEKHKTLGKDLDHEFLDNETGYLAIHIEQIKCDEMVSE